MEDYTWTVTGTGAVKVNMGETTEKEVINSYFKNAEYTPSITKALKLGDEDVTPWPDGISFDFYLSFVSGEHDGTELTKNDIIMHNREAVATETAKTGEFGKIEFKKPGTYIFTIEEVEPAGTQDHKKNGIVYSQDKVTLTVVVEEKVNEPGVLETRSKRYDVPDPSDGVEAGLIINTPDYPTYAPSVTKKLTENGQDVDETIWAEKTFTFDLAFGSEMTDEQKANVVMPSVTSKTVMEGSTNHKETFSALAFKAAGTYTFTVTEQQGTDPTVSYNTTPKSIQVTVEPDADNNLNVTKVTIDGTDITGEAIISSGVTIENTIIRTKDFEFTKIWKSVDDQQIEEWPTDPTDKTISISLYSTTTGTVGSTDPKIGDFVLSATGGGEDPYTWTGTKNSDNTYTFKITGLPATDGEGNALTYYVKETQVEGYKQPEYGMAQPVTGNNGVESTTVIGKITENDHAKDKEFITNRPDVAVTLPSTGGPGPKLFYGIGLSFIAMAGLLLFIKRKWKGIDYL